MRYGWIGGGEGGGGSFWKSVQVMSGYELSRNLRLQGESGQNAVKRFPSQEAAEKDFCKKFHDKTRNDWEDRAKFKPVTGKYTLIEMGEEDEVCAQCWVGKGGGGV